MTWFWIALGVIVLSDFIAVVCYARWRRWEDGERHFGNPGHLKQGGR